MKKQYPPILAAFISLLLIFILLTIMTSCAAKPATTTIEKEKVTAEKSNVTETTTNFAAIADEIRALVGKVNTGNKQCDSLCSLEIDRLLKQLEVEKISGENKYRILYDQYTKMLRIQVEMAATVNKTKEVDTQKETTETEKAAKTIPVPYVPDFWRWSAYFGWASAFFFGYWIIDKVKSWILLKKSL